MEELTKKWEACREDSCSGDASRKRKLSAVDLKTYKKEEEYADFYQDGEVYSPLEFLVNNGYDAKKIGNEEKQVEFIQEDGVEWHCNCSSVVSVSIVPSLMRSDSSFGIRTVMA